MSTKRSFLLLFLVILIADQLAKRWAINHAIGQINPVFALGLDFPHTNWIHLFSLAIAIILTFGLSTPVWVRALIVAGGISNLLDRLLYGGVYDWLSMPIIGGYNNLADWYIVMGVGWWLITLVLKFKNAYFIRR